MKKMLIVIDNELCEVSEINDYGYGKYLETDQGDFYLFDDHGSAGQAAREYWEDMRKHDPSEFRCIIGDERLIQWACGESDSFGISSFGEFLDIVETVPEEEFAGYDHVERYVSSMNKNLENELNLSHYAISDMVAYRHN